MKYCLKKKRKYRIMKVIKTSVAPLCLALSLLAITVGITWKFGPYTQITTDNRTASKQTTNVTDMKKTKGSDKDNNLLAVWVPYMSLSVENNPSEKAFKDKFDNIVKVAKKHKINALIVHVRPYGDSMYLSDYYPFSHILTGNQGTDPGYDAMKYMVDKSHENNLEFHAWINPLRIKLNDTPPELSPHSPYNILKNDNDRFVMEYESGIYLNPAYDKVRKYIIDSIKELISRYDVDGVQFDDYFYPDKNEEYDKEEYENYKKSIVDGKSALSQLEWRKSNINTLISGVYSGIKSVNNNIVFGISPQGNIENNALVGADVHSWGSVNGYCDYLCPQIYFSKSHKILPYNSAVKSWNELITNKKVKFYIGLGLYKAGSDADDGTWLYNDNNIAQQIEFGKQNGADGFMFYSFDYLENNQTEKEVKNAMKHL